MANINNLLNGQGMVDAEADFYVKAEPPMILRRSERLAQLEIQELLKKKRSIKNETVLQIKSESRVIQRRCKTLANIGIKAVLKKEAEDELTEKLRQKFANYRIESVKSLNDDAHYGLVATRMLLEKEALQMSRSPPKDYSAAPQHGNILCWLASIQGPPNTPYEDGVFHLRLYIPESYPMQAPKVEFVTPIYHPNIYDGKIQMGILRKNWSPAWTIAKILNAIYELLQKDPNPRNALNEDAATHFLEDPEGFKKRAHLHTRKYALSVEYGAMFCNY